MWWFGANQGDKNKKQKNTSAWWCGGACMMPYDCKLETHLMTRESILLPVHLGRR